MFRQRFPGGRRPGAPRSGAGSWRISSARERPPPRIARRMTPKTLLRWRRRFAREADPAPAFVSLGPAPMDAADWDAELDLGGGMVLRLRRRECRRAFPKPASGFRPPGRHAQVVRRPRRPGSQPARRGPRLGRLVHIYKPPAHDDEDTGLRAGRLLDLEPAPRAGPLRASRRASGGVHRALADRSPGAAGRRRLRRDPPPQALRAAAGRRARKKLEYFLIFLRFGAFGA